MTGIWPSICNIPIICQVHEYSLHMTGILMVYDHIYVIYMSYDRYMTDKSMSYDNVSRMTGIYPLQTFCAFRYQSRYGLDLSYGCLTRLTLSYDRLLSVIYLSYDRYMTDRWSYTCHMTGIWQVYDRYMTDSWSYPCHMTGIYHNVIYQVYTWYMTVI